MRESETRNRARTTPEDGEQQLVLSFMLLEGVAADAGRQLAGTGVAATPPKQNGSALEQTTGPLDGAVEAGGQPESDRGAAGGGDRPDSGAEGPPTVLDHRAGVGRRVAATAAVMPGRRNRSLEAIRGLPADWRGQHQTQVGVALARKPASGRLRSAGPCRRFVHSQRPRDGPPSRGKVQHGGSTRGVRCQVPG